MSRNDLFVGDVDHGVRGEQEQVLGAFRAGAGVYKFSTLQGWFSRQCSWNNRASWKRLASPRFVHFAHRHDRLSLAISDSSLARAFKIAGYECCNCNLVTHHLPHQKPDLGSELYGHTREPSKVSRWFVTTIAFSCSSNISHKVYTPSIHTHGTSRLCIHKYGMPVWFGVAKGCLDIHEDEDDAQRQYWPRQWILVLLVVVSVPIGPFSYATPIYFSSYFLPSSIYPRERTQFRARNEPMAKKDLASNCYFRVFDRSYVNHPKRS